jgi:hypothetical protein
MDEILDRTTLIGASGGIATFSLGQWNEILGIAVGAVTLIYLTIKVVKLLK